MRYLTPANLFDTSNKSDVDEGPQPLPLPIISVYEAIMTQTPFAHLSTDEQTALQAAVFRRLIHHLQQHSEVQNIELMNLAGFCRNCLSKWFEEAAESKGLQLDRDEVRQQIYGMPYTLWKERYQKEATVEQQQAFASRTKNI